MGLAEHTPIDSIRYAGSNGLRREFLEHVVGPQTPVIALGGGLELHAFHPLSVAQRKILFVQESQEYQSSNTDCFVAFDTLTYVPTARDYSLEYEVRGKPKNKDDVQRLFWEMSRHPTNLPYRIRSASALQCGPDQKTASHDASILLSPWGLTQLATDRGLDIYASHIREFGYQSGQTREITDFAGGLHFETLAALGYVESVDGLDPDEAGYRSRMQRAGFLAGVGVSHKILESLIHGDPMHHIISFSTFQDTISLLDKISGYNT
ncbi:hypothetical protein HY949_01620 [Candidatus Gottesmanbacteria bacterium]|nr:hypothetical protein [Candidatus Gottesmanbacteria bacterium]